MSDTKNKPASLDGKGIRRAFLSCGLPVVVYQGRVYRMPLEPTPQVALQDIGPTRGFQDLWDRDKRLPIDDIAEPACMFQPDGVGDPKDTYGQDIAQY
ncbi:MAG: hypothetical protein GY906_23800 [bacterium]|nr:hypothetical protein [bacterium]